MLQEWQEQGEEMEHFNSLPIAGSRQGLSLCKGEGVHYDLISRSPMTCCRPGVRAHPPCFTLKSFNIHRRDSHRAVGVMIAINPKMNHMVPVFLVPSAGQYFSII